MFKQPDYRLTNEQQVMTTRVVLLAYYRGGSSFLGEIFAQNPEVFYWFEPLEGFKNWKGSIVPTILETGFHFATNNSVRYVTIQ